MCTRKSSHHLRDATASLYFFVVTRRRNGGHSPAEEVVTREEKLQDEAAADNSSAKFKRVKPSSGFKPLLRPFHLQSGFLEVPKMQTKRLGYEPILLV